jgi:hypothetical protein
MIKDLFYFLYWFYAKSEKIENPAIYSFVNICVIIAFNIATIYNILFHFFDISIVNKGINVRLWGVVFGIILMIINYFTWYNKRQIIISKYKQMARKEKVRRSVFAILYVVISLLCFYVTAKAFIPWA